jgi:hypothetical protein
MIAAYQEARQRRRALRREGELGIKRGTSPETGLP